MEEAFSVDKIRPSRAAMTFACLAAACLAGATVASGAQRTAPPAPLPARISPKAQDLLNHAIQALGGAAFLNFKTVTSTGRVFGFQEGQTVAVEPYHSTAELPDKRRFSYGKGKPVILINNGDQAWQIDHLGVGPQQPEAVASWKLATRYGLENLFRRGIHEPGVLILDNGVDFVANQPVFVLTMMDSHDASITIDLHRMTYLPVRITYRLQDPKTLDRDEYTDDYSDYQLIQGIETPMHIARSLNGERIGEVFRNTVRYNDPVPANYFMPSR
jgi:hypothetical protein